MSDLSNKSFAVLTFATVNDIIDTANKRSVHMQRDAIVEVAAVKIENGEIGGHFHSFIAIDGLDAKNIEFGNFNFGSYNLNEAHLIGAPEFKDVVKRLHGFIGDSTLLVQSVRFNWNNPFQIFKGKAKEFGYLFNNSTIDLSNIYTAFKLQLALDERCIRFEDLDGIQLAQLLVEDNKENWTDILVDYNVIFNPYGEDRDRDRNDPLSWALAFARFFVNLVYVDAVMDEKKFQDDESMVAVEDGWLPF